MTDQPIDVRVTDGTDAIYGQTAGTQQDGSSGAGIYGNAFDGGTGVRGDAAGGDGVRGHSNSNQHAGVSAVNDQGGFGVWARGTPAGHFESPSADGIQGSTGSSAYSGVFGSNTSAVEPPQGSPGGSGVFGLSVVPSASGVFGAHNNAGRGVSGYSKDGVGVWGAGKTAGEFDGDVHVTGLLTVDNDVVLSGADCAEEFDLAVAAGVEPGTVMAVDDAGRLRPSTVAYDRRAAGVVSGAGAFRTGLVLDRRSTGRARLPIALTGKVYCKVDADHGAVGAGDLLTTSGTPGHAMKATDPSRAFGAVIGKALAPLAAGRGLIPILVALQ
jgi:hypothetical protein